MKYRNFLYFPLCVLLGVLLGAASAAGQTIGYRQTNLASNVSNVANNVAPELIDPWGVAFLSGQPFFLADNKVGRVTAHGANGLGERPGSFTVPNFTGTGFDAPTGIVADQSSFFSSPSSVKPFILVTDEGTIFTWGPDAVGDLPQHATLVVDNSARNAVYKGVAILSSSLTAPALAVTDFHGGFIDTFLAGFPPVALPGSFTDPSLPPGYAPFGIQVIGRQVFVTYALQDTAKHDPVSGVGNGAVSIFDMDGNFVRRFATGGALNAPWGISQAGPNFGPFSNDILIGNVGDGTMNAFDPATGSFVGVLLDGDGNDLVEVGLHALVFRTDGIGDPNTLYFTSQLSNENDGLFGAITTGLVSATRISAPDTIAGSSVTITATVAAGPGNPGAPTGTVTFLNGSVRLGTVPLVNGSATLDVTFTAVGIHAIAAQYSGDAVFLPSSVGIPLQVTGLATTLTLAAPADAAPGSSVTLTATITSRAGIPIGQIVFHDGPTSLGSSALSNAGVATLSINTLAAGTHTLTASFDGDGTFASSTSKQVSVTIANPDFAFGAAPMTATVVAGQSTQFQLTVTPNGGFAGNITFSCSPTTGITCAFNPPTLALASRSASSVLTVSTSTSVQYFGLLMTDLNAPWKLLAVMALLSLGIWRTRSSPNPRRPQFAVVVAMIVILGLAINGCGGYSGGAPVNRGTATINVVAQSGAVSHIATISVTVQ